MDRPPRRRLRLSRVRRRRLSHAQIQVEGNLKFLCHGSHAAAVVNTFEPCPGILAAGAFGDQKIGHTPAAQGFHNSLHHSRVGSGGFVGPAAHEQVGLNRYPLARAHQFLRVQGRKKLLHRLIHLCCFIPVAALDRYQPVVVMHETPAPYAPR